VSLPAMNPFLPKVSAILPLMNPILSRVRESFRR
jgi:hypothetical protein